jgi:hypothetical protein
MGDRYEHRCGVKLGSDQTNSFKYHDKHSILGPYFALKAPFPGQNGPYKAIDPREVDADRHLSSKNFDHQTSFYFFY